MLMGLDFIFLIAYNPGEWANRCQASKIRRG
jgi:hypothetical protein